MSDGTIYDEDHTLRSVRRVLLLDKTTSSRFTIAVHATRFSKGASTRLPSPVTHDRRADPLMALDTDRLGKDAITRGAQAGVSHLAGIPGHGTMQVVCGQRHVVMEACGTWRPDDDQADLTALENAERADEPVRFEGKLDDPADPDRTEVATSCRITSSGEYTFDATLPDDESRTSGCASPRFANTAPRSRAIRLSASAHRE